MIQIPFSLDFWTKVAIEAIWNEQVKEAIQNSIETGKTEDDESSDTWEFVPNTPFTEPFWGIVVNR